MSETLERQKITKGPQNEAGFRRPYALVERARDGIEAFLRQAGVGSGDTVLLPAYVGWSAREGSGVHDPVQAVGARAEFYRVGRDLRIDVEDFERKVRGPVRAAILIHYFGMPDPHVGSCCELARQARVPTLEDEAHAMLSDLVGGACGRYADAAVFSLHKMLPTHSGGMLLANNISVKLPRPSAEGPNPFEYDLATIAARRRANAKMLLRLVREFGSSVTPLWSSVPRVIVPQSLPVLIHHVNRDELYERFNAAGYGGTSLYYALIEPITEDEYPDSHWLSRRIFNLPVHQDLGLGSIEKMAATLERLARA